MSQSIKLAVVGMFACLALVAAAKSAIPSNDALKKPTIAMRAQAAR